MILGFPKPETLSPKPYTLNRLKQPEKLTRFPRKETRETPSVADFGTIEEFRVSGSGGLGIKVSGFRILGLRIRATAQDDNVLTNFNLKIRLGSGGLHGRGCGL